MFDASLQKWRILKGPGSEDTLRTAQLQTLVNKDLKLKFISDTDVQLLNSFCHKCVSNSNTEHFKVSVCVYS